MIKRTALAAVLALAAAGASQADTLRSIESRSIDLGAVSGVAYYTVEPDGLRVVATLAEGEGGGPLRVEAFLAAGQSVVLSTPRALGLPASRVEIVRAGDRVLVNEIALTGDRVLVNEVALTE